MKKTQQVDKSKPTRRVVSVVRNMGVRQGEPHFRCIEVNPKDGEAIEGMFRIFILFLLLLLLNSLMFCWMSCCFIFMIGDTISYVTCKQLQSVAKSRPYKLASEVPRRVSKQPPKKRRRYKGQ